MPPIDYSFIGPNGSYHQGTNLTAFCREYSLDYRNLYQVLMGARRHCGGFTCPDAGYYRTYSDRSKP